MIYMFKVMHYCQQMYLVTFEICILKYMNLTLLVFLVKLVKVKLDILLDINMLLMVEKSIRRNMSRIHRYAKATNKQIKGYGRNKKLSYFDYWDVND